MLIWGLQFEVGEIIWGLDILRAEKIIWGLKFRVGGSYLKSNILRD